MKPCLKTHRTAVLQTRGHPINKGSRKAHGSPCVQWNCGPERERKEQKLNHVQELGGNENWNDSLCLLHCTLEIPVVKAVCILHKHRTSILPPHVHTRVPVIMKHKSPFLAPCKMGLVCHSSHSTVPLTARFCFGRALTCTGSPEELRVGKERGRARRGSTEHASHRPPGGTPGDSTTGSLMGQTLHWIPNRAAPPAEEADHLGYAQDQATDLPAVTELRKARESGERGWGHFEGTVAMKQKPVPEVRVGGGLL